MDSPDSIHCSLCNRVVFSPKKNQGIFMTVLLSNPYLSLSKCSKCQRFFCYQCLRGEYLCHTCLNEISAGKYQFLKNAVVEWKRKILKRYLKPFRNHRALPALIWFVIFMVVANLINGPFFMLYITIAYVPIILVLFQLLFSIFKMLAIRVVGRLLFQKMLDSPLTEETSLAFPITDKDYLRTFKWKEFSKASDPLEYFLHSDELNPEKKLR